MNDTKMLTLSDGKKIILDDDNDISLSVISHNTVKNTFRLPCPSAGYGGGTLILSPSEQYLVFSFFSGESEEAFMLFQMDETSLKPLFDSGYVYGEDAHYCFINNGNILVQTLRTDFWYKENAQTDAQGERYYPFGEVNLLHLENMKWNRHRLHVYPSPDWKEEKTDIGPFSFSETVNGNLMKLIVPWGEALFPLPLQDTLIIRCF